MVNLLNFFGFDDKPKRPTGRLGHTMHMIETQRFQSLIDSGMFPDEALRVSGIINTPLSKKQEEEKKKWDENRKIEIEKKRKWKEFKEKIENSPESIIRPSIWPMVIDGTDIINKKKI